jgi:hypothetical protein
LINAASAHVTKREKEFELSLRKALLSACVEYIEFPSNTQWQFEKYGGKW